MNIAIVIAFCSSITYQTEIACLADFVKSRMVYKENTVSNDSTLEQVFSGDYWYGDCSDYAWHLRSVLAYAGYKPEYHYGMLGGRKHVWVKVDGWYVDAGGMHREIQAKKILNIAPK